MVDTHCEVVCGDVIAAVFGMCVAGGLGLLSLLVLHDLGRRVR